MILTLKSICLQVYLVFNSRLSWEILRINCQKHEKNIAILRQNVSVFVKDSRKILHPGG
jgi:hypothetical protein